MARGTPDALERFERALRHGPPMANVQRLERVGCELSEDLDGFRIEH